MIKLELFADNYGYKSNTYGIAEPARSSPQSGFLVREEGEVFPKIESCRYNSSQGQGRIISSLESEAAMINTLSGDGV